MRWLVLAAVLLGLAGAASAQIGCCIGNLPRGIGPAPISSGGGGCSNSLDYSAACNSQYIAVTL